MIILCLGIRYFSSTKPINLSNRGISKIFVVLQVSSNSISVCADAEIMGKGNIKEAIDVLNNIKIIPEKCSVYDLEGESPSAWILLYDGKKEVEHIDIYYDIIKYDDKYYRISVSEYDELIELCRQYGSISELEKE